MAVRFGLTAADAFDAAAEALEFAVSAHGNEAARAALRCESCPDDPAHRFTLVAERRAEAALRSFAKMFRERATVIRAHDEAVTKRTVPPKAPTRRWWR